MRNLKLIISSLLILGTVLSVSLFSPPVKKAQAYTVKSTHPRIWITEDTLPALKEKVGKTQDWNNLKAWTDTNGMVLNSNNIYDWMYLPDVALMYRLTGDTKYLDVALHTMRRWDVSGNATIESDSSYNARFVVPYMSAAYDWLYDYLTPEERLSFANQICDWLDYIKITYLDNYSFYSGASTNYFYGFFGAFVEGSLATYGEDDRAAGFLTYALDKMYAGKIKPYWQEAVKGGGWPEGYNYGMGVLNYGITEPFEALRIATGQNLFLDDNNVKDVVNFLLESYLPGSGVHHGQGDWPEPNNGYLRGAFLTLAKIYKADPEGKYIQYWLKNTGANSGTGLKNYAWKDFLWLDPSIEELNYKTSLPNSYIASGIGFGITRSSWDSVGTWVGFQAGKLYASHQHNDQGSFTVFSQGTLALEPGGLLSGSDSHNTLALKSVSSGRLQYQPGTPNQPAAKMTHFEDANGYTFMEGDISNAYNSDKENIHRLRYFNRVIIFLKSSTVLVFDRVGSNSSYKPVWLLHTQNQPTLKSNGSLYDNGKSALIHQAVLPTSVSVSEFVPKNLPLTDPNYSIDPNHRITVEPTTHQLDDFFLNVLEVVPTGTTTGQQALSLTSSEGTAVGTQIGNQVVMFSKTAQIDGTVSYNLDSGSGISKQLLTGLRTSFPYTVTKNGSSSTMTTSDQGTMAFDVTLGTTNNISVVPQNVPSVNITKSADKTSAKSGDTITYTINYANSGTAGALNAKIEDSIPAGTTFDSIVSGGANYDSVNKKVYLNIGNLASSATGIIQFKVKVL